MLVRQIRLVSSYIISVPVSLLAQRSGRIKVPSSVPYSTCEGSHANYSTCISVADTILTDLHRPALFHICYISVADTKMRPNSYLLQICGRYLLQIFYRYSRELICVYAAYLSVWKGIFNITCSSYKQHAYKKVLAMLSPKAHPHVFQVLRNPPRSS